MGRGPRLARGRACDPWRRPRRRARSCRRPGSARCSAARVPIAREPKTPPKPADVLGRGGASGSRRTRRSPGRRVIDRSMTAPSDGRDQHRDRHRDRGHQHGGADRGARVEPDDLERRVIHVAQGQRAERDRARLVGCARVGRAGEGGARSDGAAAGPVRAPVGRIGVVGLSARAGDGGAPGAGGPPGPTASGGEPTGGLGGWAGGWTLPPRWRVLLGHWLPRSLTEAQSCQVDPLTGDPRPPCCASMSRACAGSDPIWRVRRISAKIVRLLRRVALVRGWRSVAALDY